MAEDLLSQTFLNAWDAFDTYKPRGFPFSTWLYRIAHNLVVDHYRKREERSVISLDDPAGQKVPSKDPSVPSQGERALVKQSLRSAISHLTENQQQVIILKFIQGLDIHEIAYQMGKTDGAIRALKFRALQALRRFMADDWSDFSLS